MTPEEAPLVPEPPRNEKGQFPPGVSGNPGGIPRRGRVFQRGAAYISVKAQEALKARLEDAAAEPYKTVTIGEATYLVPKMSDRDVIAALEVNAKHAGLIAPEVLARLLLDARKTLQSAEEWDRFARLIDPDYDERPAIEAAPADPSDEEETLP